ncbi:P-loop containing nucleoside triphosphate hydrolase [Colletotrichum tofieldiae]|nr:P-loop containing nucleoside triphosphate hydrolase [Colletotrichum tofieldiae]
MASRRTHQLPLRPPVAVQERSDPNPDEGYHRERKVRYPSYPPSHGPPRIGSVSRSTPATEQGEVESHDDGGPPRK